MFQNYGSSTRVEKVRLKVALNMADPISIKDSDSRLKGESPVSRHFLRGIHIIPLTRLSTFLYRLDSKWQRHKKK